MSGRAPGCQHPQNRCLLPSPLLSLPLLLFLCLCRNLWPVALGQNKLHVCLFQALLTNFLHKTSALRKSAGAEEKRKEWREGRGRASRWVGLARSLTRPVPHRPHPR
eukprot:390215-Rhodomonas_salina.1